MKSLVRMLLGKLFRDYQLNRIYYLDIVGAERGAALELPAGAEIGVIETTAAIAASPDERIRNHSWYAGEKAHGYGIWEKGALVCMCWFWSAGHPRMPGRFAHLQSDEAVMVDLLTSPQCRGKSYALIISRFAEADLARKGFRRLWTWVWHSNDPSIRVFSKAGWHYSHFLAEFLLPGLRDYQRIRLPRIGADST